jgi:hypothetical protein
MINNDIVNFLDNIDYNNIEFKYNIFDLVFSGGGLKGFYHIGLCKILKYYENKNIIKIRHIIGTSTGAISAIMYACNIDYDTWFESYYIVKNNIDKVSMRDIVVQIMKERLPKDAYKLCNGRVKIALSKFTIFGFKEILIDHFTSNDHLISVISGAINIPLITSKTIFGNKINGDGYYYDGFFVRMTPLLYNNDLPQLLINTHLTNYSNHLSLNPKDSFIELLSLRGMYESKKFFKNNKNIDSIQWIEEKRKYKYNYNYINILIPAIFFMIVIYK